MKYLKLSVDHCVYIVLESLTPTKSILNFKI